MGYAMVVHGTTLIMSVAHKIKQVLTAIGEDRLDPGAGFCSLEEFLSARTDCPLRKPYNQAPVSCVPKPFPRLFDSLR
jgi:hypothetical protein